MKRSQDGGKRERFGCLCFSETLRELLHPLNGERCKENLGKKEVAPVNRVGGISEICKGLFKSSSSVGIKMVETSFFRVLDI